MTRGQQFPPVNHPAPYHDLSDDEDEDLSPSDGYFGGNNAVPNTVLIPDPSHPQTDPSSSTSKAKEAARESNSSATDSPSDVHYAAYTPATTHTPATSSRDSESAYNGSTSRYRDSEDALSERSPLLEEPPPLYDEAMAERAPSSNMSGTNNHMPPPQREYESMQVREPVSSFRTSGFGGRNTSQGMAIGVDNRTGKIYDEESDPVLPQRSRRPGCSGKRRPGCSGNRKAPKEGRRRFKRCLALLFGLILAIWLIAKLAKAAKHAHGRSHAPDFPINGTLPHRQIRQHETSHSISGTYPLYDLLDLKTSSGSISVTIVPHPGEAPAVLLIESSSGTINVKIDKSYLNAAQSAQYQDALDRAFETTISTSSGTIGGKLLVGGGGATSVTSRSGTLNLAVYPVNVAHGSPESKLSTTTTSGTQNIQIYSPISGGTLTQLTAHHDSIGSGTLNIRYPSTWEGAIHAKSVGSGSVHVAGPGLQYELNGRKEVLGWRGGEKNRKTIDVKTLGSGTINFKC